MACTYRVPLDYGRRIYRPATTVRLSNAYTYVLLFKRNIELSGKLNFLKKKTKKNARFPVVHY